jgi:hypothetical protein
MQSVVDQLQQERTRLERELNGVSAALSAFSKVYLGGKAKAAAPRKRTISAAGRARIAAAQKKRWAKGRAAKKKSK